MKEEYTNINVSLYNIWRDTNPYIPRYSHHYILSFQRNNQEMCDFQIQVHSILECPICLRLPRSLPVLSCTSGHIICDYCAIDEDVTDCPQCREQMYCTNTLAGQIASICIHPCSYNFLGCPVGMSMDEIESHEKVCPERTIKCIFKYEFCIYIYEHDCNFFIYSIQGVSAGDSTEKLS